MTWRFWLKHWAAETWRQLRCPHNPSDTHTGPLIGGDTYWKCDRCNRIRIIKRGTGP